MILLCILDSCAYPHDTVIFLSQVVPESAFRLLKVFWCLITTLGGLTIFLGTNKFIVTRANGEVEPLMFEDRIAESRRFYFRFVARFPY
jgi:hypothetical protein